MDESRKQFEEWWKKPEQHELRKSCAQGWGDYIWQASRRVNPVVAYLTHQGSAVSPDDFEGGEAEMHETAKREEWFPLVKKGG